MGIVSKADLYKSSQLICEQALVEWYIGLNLFNSLGGVTIDCNRSQPTGQLYFPSFYLISHEMWHSNLT